MLDAKDVASVGCMVRSGQGKTAAQGGGYSPSAINLRAMPAFAFGLIDPAVFRQPATYPVIANSLAVLMLERAAIDQLDTTGSTAVRPEIDDLLLGIQLIANGGLEPVHVHRIGQFERRARGAGRRRAVDTVSPCRPKHSPA